MTAIPSRAGVEQQALDSRPLSDLSPAISADAWDQLQESAAEAQELLAGHTIWSINSTAQGGGVAEMLRTLLPYWCGAGVDARWLVLQAPPAYFRLTKRLHDLLHGIRRRKPGLEDGELFESVARAAGVQVADAVAPGDVVILQDPQTAGLVPILKRAGAVVIWRCHVGADRSSAPVEAAWSFLLPYIEAADLYVFTRQAFVPSGLDQTRVRILAPAIDPCSAKNQPLSPGQAEAILDHAGLARAFQPTPVKAVNVQGRAVLVRRQAEVLRHGPAPKLGGERLVVALARWDRLKDPIGIIHGFADHVDVPDARLVVAGPAASAVADDPDGVKVLRQAKAAWQGLPAAARRRIQLAELPMDDLDENALIVNALQRQAAVVVKKSLQEGFGLGITEAMWKARPVIATRVGGHQDQITHRRTGLLINDPQDPLAFAAAVSEVLLNPAEAFELAAAGREHVRSRFLADRHLVEWDRALISVVTELASAL